MDYIYIPLKNRKSTINPKSNEKKCFQYAVDVALNHEQIENHPERIFKTKTFINKNDWKEICFPSYIRRIGKGLKQIMKQQLLISYTCHTIAKKEDLCIFQNITQRLKVK